MRRFAAKFSKPAAHALRVRGLKPVLFEVINRRRTVARSTRAWIETEWEEWLKSDAYAVARSTRAWIETSGEVPVVGKRFVARSTRAWIETVYVREAL